MSIKTANEWKQRVWLWVIKSMVFNAIFNFILVFIFYFFTIKTYIIYFLYLMIYIQVLSLFYFNNSINKLKCSCNWLLHTRNLAASTWGLPFVSISRLFGSPLMETGNFILIVVRTFSWHFRFILILFLWWFIEGIINYTLNME